MALLSRWLVLLLMAMASGTHALEIRLAVQDSPPKFFRQGERWSGICVDIMRAIEYVAPELRFAPLGVSQSLKQIESGLERGTLDVACGLARTEKRDERFTVIDTPLYHTFFRVAVRHDDPVDVQSLAALRRLSQESPVMVEAGSVQQEALVALGVRVSSSGLRPSENLRRLMAGEGRFLLHNDFALQKRVQRHHLEGGIRILPFRLDLATTDSGRYFVVSKKAAPELAVQLERALAGLHRSGELDRIFESFR